MGPLPIWPRGSSSELATLPSLQRCFPIGSTAHPRLLSHRVEGGNSCRGGLASSGKT